MCTFLDIAQAVASVAFTAVEIQHARTQKAESEYRANLLRKDAKTAKDNAINERQEGIEDARKQRLQAILNMGEEKTNIAAGNISMSSQTALDILDDEKLNGELNALTTLKKSEERASNYMRQSDRYYSNAALLSFNAKQTYRQRVKSLLINSTSNLVGLGVHGFDEQRKNIKEKEKGKGKDNANLFKK